MFQHKYLIYNRDCTLLTYAVQTKIRIDDQAVFKDVIHLKIIFLDKELRILRKSGY